MRARGAIPVWRGLWPALLLLAAMLATQGVSAADPKWPTLTGRVVDEAELLSGPQRAELDSKLAELETSSGTQLVVVTVNSLQGFEIGEYGVGLGRHWGIGQVGKNNGAMLIVAPNEREVRIEVGYGLEGVLTDAITSSIIQTDILPAFRSGHMDQGIVAGTDSILKALNGDYAPSKWSGGDTAELQTKLQEQMQHNNDFFFPFWIVPVAFISFWLAIVILAVRFGKKGKGTTGSGWSSSSSSSSSSSFSSSGSSFSGGGGSFGGGGSSGRW
ncbi:MAG: TPM domain-containing protein [Hypericibacter sp.]